MRIGMVGLKRNPKTRQVDLQQDRRLTSWSTVARRLYVSKRQIDDRLEDVASMTDVKAHQPAVVETICAVAKPYSARIMENQSPEVPRRANTEPVLMSPISSNICGVCFGQVRVGRVGVEEYSIPGHYVFFRFLIRLLS